MRIPPWIDRNEAFLEEILRQELGLGEEFLMEGRQIFVDLG